ncbi:ras guanine nucleotide exchange factor domain-containing protein [Blastocladiella britannica]|nr:ras guanine nucleotide exchange factor domain-containing protein [Blastocladiella britannica]
MVTIVRALYDYDGGESSNLSFKADDLIQVFTQLESGWWDGLLREERGWFPSNYVSSPLTPRTRAEEDAWVKRVAADAQAFWYNTVTGESAWERADNVLLLPDGWQLQETDDGQGTFFYHEESDEMSWTLPAVMWTAEYLATAMPPPPPALADVPVDSAATTAPTSPVAAEDATDNADAAPDMAAESGGAAMELISAAPAADDIPRRVSSNSLRLSGGASTPAPTTAAPAPAAADGTGDGPLSPTRSVGSASTSSQPAAPSAGSDRQVRAWSLLTQQIFAAIQRLLKSAKGGNKSAFINDSSRIVEAIRSMLQASGAVDKEGPTLKNNPSLKLQHRTLLGALSKLVLSAKLASGVWPPPDAVQKMIVEASELLASVKGFVEAARQCNVDVKTDIIDEKDKEERERAEREAAETAARQQQQQQRTRVPSAALSISLTNETVQQLAGLSGNVLSTLGQLYAKTQEQITVVTLVGLTRSAVTEVGGFLSFIEDIHLEEGPDSPLMHEFKIYKQALYNNLTGLVMATTTATGPHAPADAMDQVVVSITVVERSVKDLLQSTQQLLEAKYRREHRRSSMAAPVVPLSPISPFPQQKPIGAEKLALNTELANSVAQRHLAMGQRSATQSSFTTLYASGGMGSGGRAPSMGASPSTPPYSAKLRKFFGDDVDPSMLPSPVSGGSGGPGGPGGMRGLSGMRGASSEFGEQVPWFLATDYAPNEIVFNMEGLVKGGTLRSLVERLTVHEGLDVSYQTGFLFSYRTFMTSTDLMDALMARFNIQPPSGLSDSELETWIERKMTPVRVAVFDVMSMWLEHFALPYIPDDMAALDQMRNWSRTVMRPVMAAQSVQLIKHIERREQSPTPHLPLRPVPAANGAQPMFPQGPPPSPLLPRNIKKMKFTEIDPLEIARQLTLIEFSYFTRLIYTEFLNKAWSAEQGSTEEANARAPNLRRMAEMSNSVTGWVAESILAEEDPKKRCALLKHYIQIADKCRSLNNYNTLFSILAALNSAPIHRLSRTWEQLSTKTLSLLNDLRTITDPSRNFATYRELLASVLPPCIPFLGRYLSDLTFLEDGNANIIKIAGIADDSSPDMPVLVNFSKRQRTAEIIREIQQFQVLPFHLKAVPEVQDYLLGMINHNRDSEELYEISMNREPREREDQKLVRLLEESGLL